MGDGVRSVEALAVDESGRLSGLFPPGPLIFPAAADEVAALDAAVRAALAERILVPPGPDGPRLAALRAYIARRRPGFRRDLAAQLAPIDPPALTATAAALGITAADLRRRLQPAAPDDPLLVPVTVRTTLARAVTRLTGLAAVGAPPAVLEHTRRAALTVATAGWRPPLRPTVESARHAAALADPAYTSTVTVDIAEPVLLATLCCVGAATRALTTDTSTLRWHDLGGSDEHPAPAPPRGTVVVETSVYAETVHRLQFARLPTGTLLAVTMTAAAEDD